MTLVIYMGVARCAQIVGELIAAGLAEDTPAAVISQACCADQRQALCTLESLPRTVEAGGFASPALLVIGDVVSAAPAWAAGAGDAPSQAAKATA